MISTTTITNNTPRQEISLIELSKPRLAFSRAWQRYRAAPTDTGALEGMGDCALRVGAAARALSWYSSSGETGPLLAKRVRCHIQQGHFEEAGTLIGNPKIQSVAHRVLDLLSLEVKTGLGKFLDAICAAQTGAREYPQERNFILRGVDAWLGYDALGRKKHPNMSVFASNFNQIRTFFSSQPLYSPNLHRLSDIMQQEIDLFDYCMTRSNEAVPIFSSILREKLQNAQFHTLFLAHVERKLAQMENTRKEFEDQIVACRAKEDSQNEAEREFSALELEGVNMALQGPHGLANYSRRYSEVLKETGFREMGERVFTINSVLQKVSDAKVTGSKKG
jgi:hypothetical protein